MVHRQFIDGSWAASRAATVYEHHNPADLREVTGVWPAGDRADARAAIEAAAAAFPAWRATTAFRRADMLGAALRAIDRRREDMALTITRENGKTLAESRSEVQAAYREMEYQIAEGVRLPGRMRPTTAPGVLAYEVREPLGVVSIIAPWNFPFNVPIRKIVPALMAGNTVVFKPASLTPGVGTAIAEAMEEADLPPGVFNMVVGGGSTVGQELTSAAEVRAVSFTGSTEVGRGIHREAAAHMIRTQLEMGGKSALVVLADADLDEAAEAAARAAFACAGQWCTSTSRVVVERSVHEGFLAVLLRKVGEIRVGRGDGDATMGPVCGTDQLTTIMRYIEIGLGEGARPVAGGSRLTRTPLDRGCFIEPTVFDAVAPGMTIAQEEIFGPVLAVLTADGFDEAIRVANAVPFGLSSAVYTRDLERALTFVERIEAGLTHVNLNTAYKEPAFAFGGIKASGFGTPEAGESGIEFFTDHKVAYIRYRP